MDTHFGRVYKALRTSKKLTLKEIATDTLSIGTISKFENEKNSLTIEKFYEALKAINVSLSEFQNYHELSYETETFPLVRKQIIGAYRTGSIAKLQIILKELGVEKKRSYQEKIQNNLYKIVAKACIYTIDNRQEVEQSDVDFLFRYLLPIKIWSHFEIWLLSASAMIFDKKQIRMLAQDFFGKFHLYSTDPYTYTIVLMALHNLINAALTKEVYDAAFHLLSSVNTIEISELDMEAKLFLLYDQGWYDAVTGKREEGLAQMRKVQEIIAFVDTTGNLSEMFRREIEELIRTDFHI